jgi:CheY-like chemotaxis protein
VQSLASLLRDNGLTDAVESRSSTVVVAVVDDQPVSRTLITRLLKDVDASIEVEPFADPATALAWLSDARPALIVTDYRMPQMDGIEFVKALRALESTKWTPIMLVTVLDDHEVRKRALQAGATDFLNKPIDHDECKARCRNYIDLSGNQAFLLEQLLIRDAYIRNLRQSCGQAVDPTAEEMLGVAQNGRYVLMEYRELYEVTSRLAAIEKLLKPARSKLAELEAAVQRPLQGDRRER